LKRRFCFVTEADLERKGVGGVMTDLQTLRSLEEFGDVDVIYLKRIRYRSTPLALMAFFFEILKSFSEPYHAYFARGLITSLFLVSINTLMLGKRKIVQRALSVPIGSREVKFLGYNGVEALLRYSLFVFLERFVYSNVNSITVAGERYVRELVQAGVEQDKVYITNFTVGDEFFATPLKNKAEGAFNFCYVGGFHLYQDLLPVLDAFESLSHTNNDVELVLVGNGPQRPRLEEEAMNRKMNNKVKFMGKIPHSYLPTFMSKVDCFISITHKPGLSISIVEAAAAGRAIIAFSPINQQKYNDFFTHGKEIYLVHSVSPDEIEKAMKLLHKNYNLRNAIARGARQVAEQHFSQRVARKQLERLINNIR
jgi:glycosyltransferase involved in cell wall biosynthesis